MVSKKHKSLSSLEKDIFFKRGIYFFNRQDFYECHESLEHIWLAEEGDNRLFYQGLIQAASAFYHVKKGRYYPALQCLRKSIQKLSGYSSPPWKVDVGRFLSDLKDWQENILENLRGAPLKSRLAFPKIIVSLPTNVGGNFTKM